MEKVIFLMHKEAPNVAMNKVTVDRLQQELYEQGIEAQAYIRSWDKTRRPAGASGPIYYGLVIDGTKYYEAAEVEKLLAPLESVGIVTRVDWAGNHYFEFPIPNALAGRGYGDRILSGGVDAVNRWSLDQVQQANKAGGVLLGSRRVRLLPPTFDFGL